MDNQVISAEQTQDGVDRRSLIGQFGATAATVMAMGAVATGGAALSSRPPAAQAVTDADVLNFALNLEYLEGEYYSRGFLGPIREQLLGRDG